MPRVMGDHEHRQRLYCTPAHVVRALLEREKFPGIIWEPAAGKGHIVRALRSYGYRDVVASDLNDWGFRAGRIEDFLTSTTRADCLITNPPFDLKFQFLLQAKRLASHKIALLMPIDVEYLKRFIPHEFGRDFRWKALYAFRQAIPFRNMNETWGKIKMAWFVFERGYGGPQRREKIPFRRHSAKRKEPPQ